MNKLLRNNQTFLLVGRMVKINISLFKVIAGR
jgi:hypothetical protein